MSLTTNLTVMTRLLSETEAKISIQIKGYEKLSAQKSQMMMDGAKQLSPNIHQELGNSYSRSGLGIDTGQLRSAVLSSSLTVTPTNIKCTLPGGKPDKFYKYASSQQYGYLTGKGSKGMGKRLKSKIKKSGATAVGMKIHPGKKYYVLSSDQIQKLSNELTRKLQPVVTQVGKGA